MTDRLTPSDAALLYAADDGAPAHVGGVTIVQPRGEFDFERVIDSVTHRLAELPRFRQVVRRVPGNLARPVWVDDVAFDVTYHVRRTSLAASGAASLDELVGRIVSRPLDRARPLWELYLIEGLDGGRAALVSKTHEALVGGVGPADIAAALLDDASPGQSSASSPWIAAPEPSQTDLVRGAIAELAEAPSTWWAAASDVRRLWMADARHLVTRMASVGREVVDVVTRAVQPPGRPLLHAGQPGPRTFASVDVDLAALKQIRHRHETTVNDVILAVVTGALRSWLIAHGDPIPAASRLIALAPMSIRPDVDGDAPGSGGGASTGAVASLTVEVPVAEPNAVMRLHQIAFATRTHGSAGRRVSASTLLSLGRFAPASLHSMGARIGSQISRRSYDVLITNVPGPQRQLFVAGEPVVGMYPAMPLVRGHAVAVGCTSYRGQVHFGLTADRDAMPDVADCARLIVDAVEELARASGANGKSKAEGRGGA